MSVDSTNSGQPSPQWREAYPEALREREQKLLRSRKRDNDEDAFETPQVGVGLSGGGLHSATFAFGILQALAKRGALRDIDVLSTVSGGGYVGALISRLYSRDAVKGPDDVARAILPPYEGQNQDEEDQAGKEDSRISRGVVWKWLKANGRYLAPAKGSGDILLAGAVMIRNWLAVHFVLATLVLALFVGLHLVRELADSFFSNVMVNQSCALSDEPNDSIAAPAAGFPPFVAVDEWLNCQLPFGGTYLWWSPWFVAPVLVLLCAVLLGAATWVLGGDIFSKRRHRCSVMLKRVLLLFGFTFGLAVVETLGQTIYLWWRDPAVSVDGWFLTGFVVVVIAAANVRNLAACFSDEHRDKWKGFPARLMLIVAAALLFTATFTAVNVLAHGIAWSFKYPSQVPRTLLESSMRERDYGPESARGEQNPCELGVNVVYCPGSHVLQILDCSDCIAVGGRRGLKLSAWFGTLALLSVLFGRSQAFLNHASLWPLYAARLIRAYAGASNPKRVNLSSGEDDHLGRVNVTHVDEDDDTSVNWPCEAQAGLEKGAPLHLVNVTINETLDGGSGLQHNDLRGIGMAIGPAGISAGIRHHLVFAEPSWRTAYVFPEAPPEDPKAGEKYARAASRPYRMFEYGSKAEGAEHGPCPVRYEGEGLTLGRWTGISGAAFSTGMGSRTSLAASLLLGFFNVRLGYWWDSGIKSGRRSGVVTRTGACERAFSWLFPVQSHLLAEFMARFHGPARRWWNLSDGGHFENMGGYELIRRRLPLIVIVDAEADPDYRFEGLGNLVRKARVDFGAEIEFVAPDKLADDGLVAKRRLGSLEMLRRGAQGTGPASLSPPHRSLAHAALAIVRYLDGATPDSLLVYVKPTIFGDEPVDILNYHAENPDFPQQTTADQFFDEAQWESYRKLGRLVGERVFKKGFRVYLRLRDKHLSNGDQSTS